MEEIISFDTSTVVIASTKIIFRMIGLHGLQCWSDG